MCFSVAILEMRSSADMSESEIAPRRLRVRRICFLTDEKPASRPPASTSLTVAMNCQIAISYHIPIRLQIGNSTSSPVARNSRGRDESAPLRIKAEADCVLLPSDRDDH